MSKFLSSIFAKITKKRHGRHEIGREKCQSEERHFHGVDYDPDEVEEQKIVLGWYSAHGIVKPLVLSNKEQPDMVTLWLLERLAVSPGSQAQVIHTDRFWQQSDHSIQFYKI